MSPSPDLTWQPSLLSAGETIDIDRSFSGLRRLHLDAEAWVDHVAGWVSGADRLFEELLTGRQWEQRTRHMYDQKVREPRLTSGWNLRPGQPLEPPVLEEMRLALSKHYGREFDSAGFNLYRDGWDSVAWHGDRIAEEIEDPIVALVSLGEPRRFLLRPKEGGRSRVLVPGRGDLLVTGGKTQRTWEHSIPKVAQAGPRISIAFRHDLDVAAYRQKTVEPAAGPARGEDPNRVEAP